MRGAAAGEDPSYARRAAAVERRLMQRRRDKAWFRVEDMYSEFVARTEANNLTTSGAARSGASSGITVDEVRNAFESFTSPTQQADTSLKRARKNAVLKAG
jgi:hypothetical protein